MFGLSTVLTALLVLCILCVCAFEFINGFHDTANAVATVIYTKSLKPVQAVVLSGLLNGLGVFLGGIGVAMGIIHMLPVETLVDQSITHSLGMVGAILFTAILWNLGTWYLGIPASSSHTLIGSILGVGIAYGFLGEGESSVNWRKVIHIGEALLFSPAFGFLLAMFLMMLLKAIFTKNKQLFASPDGDTPPPLWIRAILILTCSAVSFSHRSNDGQKGIGLMMLILIGVAPSYFALDRSTTPAEMAAAVAALESSAADWRQAGSQAAHQPALDRLSSHVAALTTMRVESGDFVDLADEQRFALRREILLALDAARDMTKDHEGEPTAALIALKKSTDELASFTEYAPTWVIVLIALSLGIGTMIGWKRIVVTIGEKIGKTHLSYAQGASAELVAASTIAVSTYLHLPVSTTHVLSSGIAGTMFARGGKENLQKSTVTKILWAWVLTVPFCITVSGALFLLFRALSG